MRLSHAAVGESGQQIVGPCFGNLALKLVQNPRRSKVIYKCLNTKLRLQIGHPIESEIKMWLENFSGIFSAFVSAGVGGGGGGLRLD